MSEAGFRSAYTRAVGLDADGAGTLAGALMNDATGVSDQAMDP